MTGKQYAKKEQNTYSLVFFKKIIIKDNRKNQRSSINKQNSNTKIIMHCWYFQKNKFSKTNKTNKKQKIVFANYKSMQTYCLECKKHTYNVSPKKQIMMTNIKIKRSQDVLIVWQKNSFFDEIKHKSEVEIIMSKFLIDYLWNRGW